MEILGVQLGNLEDIGKSMEISVIYRNSGSTWDLLHDINKSQDLLQGKIETGFPMVFPIEYRLGFPVTVPFNPMNHGHIMGPIIVISDYVGY